MKLKIITDINLTGDKEYDNYLLNTVALKTRILIINQDTIHVIRVHFMEENTYGQFVKLINLMKLEMQCCYAYIGDEFYIWEEPKQ